MADWTLVGDIHAQPNNEDKVNAIFDLIESLGNPTVLLGDILHTKEVIRGASLNLIYRRLKNSKLEFIILVGNHDWFNHECKDHSLVTLADLPNVIVVDKRYEYPGLGTLLPYFHDMQEFKKNLDEAEHTVLFQHQGIEHFDYGNGKIADSSEPPKKWFDKFDKVFSGHFHKKQFLDNIFFLGTPFSHDQGETNQRKVIGVYDTQTRLLKTMYTNLPEHRTRNLICSGDGKDAEHLKELVNDGNHWRIVLEGRQVDVDAFPREQFPHVKFIDLPELESAEDLIINEIESNEVKFTKWAKDLKNLDEETIQMGIKIMRSV